jgi:beta-lactamase class A
VTKRTMRVGEIDAAVETLLAGYPGVLGFYARNLTTREGLGYREDAVMPTASAIKVGIMAELYRRIEVGAIDPAQRLTIAAGDRVEGTGVLNDLAPGLTPTIADLCHLMIVVSDNVATGMLVRLLGKDRINRSFADWGLPATSLVWDEVSEDPRRYAVSSARDLGRLMESIATDGFVSPAACAAMRDHLSRQQQRDQIPRFLPGPPRVVVMNKPGVDAEVRTDVAIVAAPEVTFVLATLNEGGPEIGSRLDRPGNLLNARVAKFVFDAWVNAS